MAPLTKQLEDKKKGCGTMITIGLEYSHCGFRNTFFCDNCKSNIAILEQAIAEMQKQRQDFERILNRIIGKLEDGRNQREEITDYCKAKKQQLNQPKEEQ